MIFCFTEQDIGKRWLQLVKKFKAEHKKVQSYCPSGSGNQKNDLWELYDAILWLLPCLEHVSEISSECFDESFESAITDEKYKKKEDISGLLLDKMLDENEKLINSLTEITNDNISMVKHEQTVKRFMRPIKVGFDQVPAERKYKCFRDIISHITECKARSSSYN